MTTSTTTKTTTTTTNVQVAQGTGRDATAAVVWTDWMVKLNEQGATDVVRSLRKAGRCARAVTVTTVATIKVLS